MRVRGGELGFNGGDEMNEFGVSGSIDGLAGSGINEVGDGVCELGGMLVLL